jgi:hypothetical protein
MPMSVANSTVMGTRAKQDCYGTITGKMFYIKGKPNNEAGKN